MSELCKLFILLSFFFSIAASAFVRLVVLVLFASPLINLVVPSCPDADIALLHIDLLLLIADIALINYRI